METICFPTLSAATQIRRFACDKDPEGFTATACVPHHLI